MVIAPNVIANADDFGLNSTINVAILYCFENGIVNSTSMMVNTGFFEESVQLIQKNPVVSNVGIHINLAEGKPVTGFNDRKYIDHNGNWDFAKVNNKFNFLNRAEKESFKKEIDAQIDKALSSGLKITHIDSHCHLHNLPCFYQLFLAVAKQHKLKIRLAQTYFEGSYLNFYYRKYINAVFKKSDCNYSDYFENPNVFLKRSGPVDTRQTVELMLHPDYDEQGNLSDHFDPGGFSEWVNFLKK